jgi:hypothetical protein
VTAADEHDTASNRWVWWLAFGALALYVAVRMGAFALQSEVITPSGPVELPNTYASVDHPFHVARAEVLWRELAGGRLLRWVGQHQGGYPVEFYPLGEAWFEVAIRGLSVGSLDAESAHTLAVIALFLLPGAAFAALARLDGWSPAVGIVALTLHVALPGGWYHGGYTELVQWGLVTNVAAAVASILMLPVLARFLATGDGWAGAIAVGLAGAAVYCNPRSVLGLVALGGGAWIAGVAIRRSDSAPGRAAGSGAFSRRGGVARAAQASPPQRWWRARAGARRRAPVGMAQVPLAGTVGQESEAARAGIQTLRLMQVAIFGALLAAPELLALARFGGLYAFVQYSGYASVDQYVATAVSALSWPVFVLALVGAAVGILARERLATRSVAAAVALYVLVTLGVAFVPAIEGLAPQLEPTRLMPLQRFLSLYLAAAALWAALTWLQARFVPKQGWTSSVAAVGIAAALMVVQTRPIAGIPDAASPEIPAVSLYAVTRAASAEQADLEGAIRAADDAAAPGTALLVLGSAVSWHQPLWAPLWTARPLFYDNWLWYWQPRHAGTPGYVFSAGHHYPDPEHTLDRGYLGRHGIGGVVVTGSARDAAAASPLLRPVRAGIYDAYVVLDHVTTVTFGNADAASTSFGNGRVDATASAAGAPVTARVNWFPRWEAFIDGRHADIAMRPDGYLDVATGEPASSARFVYTVQAIDWLARALALAGVAGALWLLLGSFRRASGWHWYPPLPDGESRLGGDGSRAGTHKGEMDQERRVV